jgi:hypothetical protein
MVRHTSVASIRADTRLLAELLHRGGILIIIRDPADIPIPIARALIQPDSDVMLSFDRRCLLDSALQTRILDEQRAISDHLATATRPITVLPLLTQPVFAAVFIVAARQIFATIEAWFIQIAVSGATVLLVMLAEAIARRLLLRWLLRHL